MAEIPALLCTWCDPPTPIEPTWTAFKQHKRNHLGDHKHIRGDDLPLALESNPGIAIRLGFACRTCGLTTRGNRTKGKHSHPMECTFVTAKNWDNTKSIRELVLADGGGDPSSHLEHLARMAEEYESNIRGEFGCLESVFETGGGEKVTLPERQYAAKDEIKLADMYRQYRQRGEGLDDLQTAHGALLPAQYQFMTCEDVSVCPVTICSKLYRTCEELGRHFSVAHAFWAFNDNLDGTLSLVGECSGPRPIVVSREAPADNDDAARPLTRTNEPEEADAPPQRKPRERTLDTDDLERQHAAKRRRLSSASTEILELREEPGNVRQPSPQQIENIEPAAPTPTNTPEKVTIKDYWARSSASPGKPVFSDTQKSDIKDIVRQAAAGVPMCTNSIREYVSFCLPPDGNKIQIMDPGLWEEWRDQGLTPKNTPELQPGKYLVIPACEEGHWYAIIVCRKPGSHDDTLFAFLDPLERDHLDDCSLLLAYVKRAMAFSIRERDFMCKHARYIPRQAEFADSGVYMLVYISRFIKAPERTIQSIVDNQDLGWSIDPVLSRRKIFRSIARIQGERFFEDLKQTLGGAFQSAYKKLEEHGDHFPQVRDKLRIFGLSSIEQLSSVASSSPTRYQSDGPTGGGNGEGSSQPSDLAPTPEAPKVSEAAEVPEAPKEPEAGSATNAPDSSHAANTTEAEEDPCPRPHEKETGKKGTRRRSCTLDDASFTLEPFWSPSTSSDET